MSSVASSQTAVTPITFENYLDKVDRLEPKLKHHAPGPGMVILTAANGENYALVNTPTGNYEIGDESVLVA